MSSRGKHRYVGGALPPGVLLLVLAALMIGMFLPSLSCAIQSSRLEGLRERPDLGAGELSLTSDDIKIERLALPQNIQLKEEMGIHVDSLELSAGRFMDEESATDKLDELELILQGTGLDIGSISKKDLEFAQPILVMNEGSGAAGVVVWMLSFGKATGPIWESLSYIVDESTGIIICAEYSIYDQRESEYGVSAYSGANSSGNYLQTLSALAENMKKSYNFAQTDIEPQRVEGELGPFQNIFYIYFVQREETKLSIPVLLDGSNWMINVR